MTKSPINIARALLNPARDFTRRGAPGDLERAQEYYRQALQAFQALVAGVTFRRSNNKWSSSGTLKLPHNIRTGQSRHLKARWYNDPGMVFIPQPGLLINSLLVF